MTRWLRRAWGWFLRLVRPSLATIRYVDNFLVCLHRFLHQDYRRLHTVFSLALHRLNHPYSATSPVVRKEVVWRNCGVSLVLHINQHIHARTIFCSLQWSHLRHEQSYLLVAVPNHTSAAAHLIRGCRSNLRISHQLRSQLLDTQPEEQRT